MRNAVLFSIIFGIFLVLNSPCVLADATIPDPPVNLTVAYAQDAQGSHYYLTWDAPSTDGGSAIIGYRIEYANLQYYSGSQSSYWEELVADTDSTDTEYTHDAGGAYGYSYRVFAINSEGISLPSNYGRYGTAWITGADVPSIVDPIVTERVSLTQVNLSWSEPNDNGLPIIGYKIECRINGVISILVENTNNQNTFYTHSNITSDWYHYYKVYAINALGVGDATDWTQANLWEQQESSNTPGPPRNVIAESKPCAVYLSWDPPTNDGASPIIQYMIQYQEIEEQHWILIGSTTNTTYTHTAQEEHSRGGFLCGTTYCYQIYAVNAQGGGESSIRVCGSPTDCYDDYDCDGVINVADNCPSAYNPNQDDIDEDGIGDACDDDEEEPADTPGFEFLILLFAIGLLLIWKKS